MFTRFCIAKIYDLLVSLSRKTGAHRRTPGRPGQCQQAKRTPSRLYKAKGRTPQKWNELTLYRNITWKPFHKIIEGASVAEWLQSLTSNHLPLINVGSKPHLRRRILHVRKPSSWLTEGQWFYLGARSSWNYVRRGTWGLPSPLKLGSRHMA